MRRAAYTYGNTARQTERHEQPDIHPIREERRRARSLVHFDVVSVLVVVASLAIMLGVVFQFIRLQTDVTKSRENYAAMRLEYEELKRSNDLYHERIVSKVDISEVVRIAEEELGMKLAGEGQIISYSGQIDDYVKQYTDIPGTKTE
ncbi:MAG: hypothetical protein IKO11_03225 [Lachnospiraceae bacterium]|nr:hypothetical protein [Lachnospiraceae bacterium]MCR4642176.1 hypothetical protein [Lachnospiraceae bacterium]